MLSTINEQHPRHKNLTPCLPHRNACFKFCDNFFFNHAQVTNLSTSLLFLSPCLRAPHTPPNHLSRSLPLDHIFAASVRIYTRSRLRSGFLKWRVSSAAETQRHHHRMKAIAALQAFLRLSIAHRTAAQHPLEHGPATRRSCGVIQNAFRKHLARRSVLACITRIDQHELEESTKTEQEMDTLEAENRRRSEACKVIQTAWRGAIGRSVGTARARRELKAILLDFGGGLGRMHR